MDSFLFDTLSIDNVSVVNPIVGLDCFDAVLPLLHDEQQISNIIKEV